MSEGRSGVMRDLVGAAVAEHAAVSAAAAGEQLPMFDLPTRRGGHAKAAMQRDAEKHHAAGRPPGAQNLTTRQFREYLLARGVSPLVWAARWGLMTPAQLANELGCSKLEAFRELRAIAFELAPYLHAKVLPSDDDGKTPPFLQLVIGGQALGPGAAAPWMYLDAETQQNQSLALSAPDVSHAGLSHDEAK